MKRTIATLLLLACGFIAGCDDLEALCNAGGYGSPEECAARWGGK